jgi:hypothetical protein
MEVHFDRLKKLVKAKSVGGWLLVLAGIFWRRLGDWQTVEWLGQHWPKSWPRTMPPFSHNTIFLFIGAFVWLTLVVLIPERKKKGAESLHRESPKAVEVPPPVADRQAADQRAVNWLHEHAKVYSAEELKPLPSWPDVLLQWKWAEIKDAALTPNSWVVRKRSLALSNPGSEPIYNVSITDIDLGKYDAKFHVFSHLHGKAEYLFPVIYRKNGDIENAHDFESCLTHTDEPARMYGGSGTEQLALKIPFKVRCADKLGDEYEIPYVFHYDIYEGAGEAFRAGGIRKVI